MANIAAITGGAEGIGRALAITFASQGYQVSLCDVNKEAGFEVIREIRQMGGRAMFMKVDAAKPEELERWIKLTIADLGGIDVMINNVGIGHAANALELALEDFDRVLNVNLRSAFYCTQLAGRWMKDEGGGGSVINIASTRALMSEANTEAYAASKGGILALTHAMAVSLGKHGIRVNAISPGWIDTAQWRGLGEAYVPQHSEADKTQHPVGRVGRPEDIAEACLFLADGKKSGFMTGQNLVIDGGMTIKMIYEE